MENQVNSKSIILNYGLYLGLLGIFIHLIFYAAGSLIASSSIIGIVGIVAMISFIILGIKKFKTTNSGFLSFGEALKVGVGIAVVSAVISAVYTLIFTNLIQPDFQEQVMEIQKQAWLDAGLNDQEVEKSAAIAKQFSGPGITIPVSIVISAFFGFIFSAIGGAIMKHTPEDQY
ncbi:DUF4199 domain-containing protein [Tenacibaculum finnmarkense]|uniref:DUF4199 domain-containing protein n=1 Tax=Tenacibaculum finnmarkense TaxID=2781243 RepID=UPI00187B7330|nr:DUF4199 domain-containing protein [Tenacibaculum finnmarkense]MBE7645473.1 DUF4199 family protein [Tenacibaculum finnmarkense genomovar ulcerans]MBE7687524.1 DUF4199 family protein [Tenacibaculum finnmarkense genomovar ulcerans]MCD8409592.1 DUF4199 domain-containing protein [Tenacibaculum finnmarkense genomovar ulcerans]MCD8432274.1 DUF4199 domain-containing protein [Tenacibaculum finnmarkense genomovar ulcerans]MCD8445247.1 DUF4199 domain-containing protein [Tenacibaculum finnmarkense geno